MPAPPRGTGLIVLTSGPQQPQVPQQPPKQPNVWGSSGSAVPFRTLSDVVKSTPTLKNLPETPVVAKSQDPKPPVVDYFDFTS